MIVTQQTAKALATDRRGNLRLAVMFAMQPDGSGLRQLTNARGAVRDADHKYEVETVDAFWSAPY